MTEKKDDNASLARKAYGDATTALRATHKDEFNALLDQAYANLGLVSPRVKRAEKAAEAAAAKEAAAVKREERRLARIAKLEEELAKAKAAEQAHLPVEDDPMAVFLETEEPMSA